MTGAVNLSMSTMDTGNGIAFAVLSMYTLCWTLLALAVWREGIDVFKVRNDPRSAFRAVADCNMSGGS
jgi:hypothetical protein